ncbi:MAG TPA: hypothetical protein VGN90_02580 [Pyrinomonadaceae bacterium]|jgi:hypothetical protein|nr:hypothetical protein [Pyrinomonadaceae bacterium]
MRSTLRSSISVALVVVALSVVLANRGPALFDTFQFRASAQRAVPKPDEKPKEEPKKCHTERYVCGHHSESYVCGHHTERYICGSHKECPDGNRSPCWDMPDWCTRDVPEYCDRDVDDYCTREVCE